MFFIRLGLWIQSTLFWRQKHFSALFHALRPSSYSRPFLIINNLPISRRGSVSEGNRQKMIRDGVLKCRCRERWAMLPWVETKIAALWPWHLSWASRFLGKENSPEGFHDDDDAQWKRKTGSIRSFSGARSLMNVWQVSSHCRQSKTLESTLMGWSRCATETRDVKK